MLTEVRALSSKVGGKPAECEQKEQPWEQKEEKLGAFPESLTLATGPCQQRPCVKLAVLIWTSSRLRQPRCSGSSCSTELNTVPGVSMNPPDPNHPGDAEEQKAFCYRRTAQGTADRPQDR